MTLGPDTFGRVVDSIVRSSGLSAVELSLEAGWTPRDHIAPAWSGAVRKLRTLRLIVTEQHRFGESIAAITHMRLTAQGQAAIREATSA